MDNSIPKSSSAARPQTILQTAPSPVAADHKAARTSHQIALLSEADKALQEDNLKLTTIYRPPPLTTQPDREQQAALARLQEQLRQPAMRGKAEKIFSQLIRSVNPDPSF